MKTSIMSSSHCLEATASQTLGYPIVFKAQLNLGFHYDTLDVYRMLMSVFICCLHSFIETKFNGLKRTLTGFNIFTNELQAYTVQSKYMHKSHVFKEAIFQTKLKLKHENKQSDTARLQSPLTALAKDFSSIKGKANLHS